MKRRDQLPSSLLMTKENGLLDSECEKRQLSLLLMESARQNNSPSAVRMSQIRASCERKSERGRDSFLGRT